MPSLMAAQPNIGGAQETAKHRSKFCWPLVSDVAAVTKPRCETRWNLLRCLKLLNRSQPLVSTSSPYCRDMWRRYCCFTRFFPIVYRCLSCKDAVWQSCAMVCRWRFFASFCVLYFQRATCSTFHWAWNVKSCVHCVMLVGDMLDHKCCVCVCFRRQ